MIGDVRVLVAHVLVEMDDILGLHAVPGISKVSLHFLNITFLPLILTIYTYFGHQTVGNLVGFQVISLKILDLVRQQSYNKNSEDYQKFPTRILAMAFTNIPNRQTFWPLTEVIDSFLY